MSLQLQVDVTVTCDSCDREFNNDWFDYDVDPEEEAKDLVENAGGTTSVDVGGDYYGMLCESCWDDVSNGCSFCDSEDYAWNDNLYWCFDEHWSDDHEECALEAHRRWWADGDLNLDPAFECEECGTPVMPSLNINTTKSGKPKIRLKASV